MTYNSPYKQHLNRAKSGFSSLVSLPQEAPFEKYQTDYAGFFYDQLRASVLTSPQLRVLNAVQNYQSTVVTSATGTGKTYLIGGLAALMYSCWERCGIYIAAAPPEPNLKDLAWGEVMRFVSKSPELFQNSVIVDLKISKGEKIPGKTGLKPGRSRIRGLTIPSQGRDDRMETSFSGKHHEDILAFLFDEADGIPDPCYRGADGCMSGSGHMRQVMFLNPKVRDGIPYDKVESKKAHHVVLSAFEHPNVISGTNNIPGAVTREVTVVRINEWSVNIADGETPDEWCFKLPDFLDGEVAPDGSGGLYSALPSGWRRVTDPQFFYKVLGVYPPVSAGYLVDPVKLQRAVTRWHIYRQNHGGVPDGLAPEMYLDISDGGDLSTAVFVYGDYVDMPVSVPGADAYQYAHNAGMIYHARRASMCVTDAIGVGAMVPSIMTNDEGCAVVLGHKGTRSAPWSMHGQFGIMRDYCLWMLAHWINNNENCMIPDDERLIKSLKALTAVTTDATRVIEKPKLRKILGFSPDAMDALSMKFAAATFYSGAV